jgi:hypothetical protein
MRLMKKCVNQVFILFFGWLLLSATAVKAQDDLLSLLGDEENKKEFVKNAFKATRVITGQSMEQVAAGVLDFRILHRFGRVNEGAYGAYGLDQATIRLGLDYGISNRIMIGVGRSSNRKELDGSHDMARKGKRFYSFLCDSYLRCHEGWSEMGRSGS